MTKQIFFGSLKITLFIFLGFCLHSQYILADESEDEMLVRAFALSLKQLLNMEVITATKTAQKISEAPATIYAFSREQIKNRGYRNLEQLLDDVPEIEIQHRSVAEYNNYYSIRGIAGNDKLVVLLDGYRVNSPTGSPHAIATNYSLVDAERVEVILGPASALYGADALSGIINIITRQPEAASYTQLYASNGSFSTQEYAFNGRYQYKDLKVMLTGQFYQSDEDNLAESYPEYFGWYNDQYLNQGIVQVAPFLPPEQTVSVPIKSYATPTESHFIHFSGNINEFNFGFSDIMESHSSVIGLKPEFNLYINEAIYKTQIQNIFAEHSSQNDDDNLNFKTSLSYSAYEVKPDSAFYNTFTQYSAGYKYAKATTTKFEEQITYVMDDENQIIGGLSYETISAIPKTGDLPFQFDPDIPAALQNLYYLGTNVMDIYGNDLTIYQSFFEINYQNVAFYTQWQHQFSEALSLTSGLRYDDNTRYGSTVNPRVGLVYNVSDSVTIKALYNTGFLAPSPYVAYQHYGAFVPVDDNLNSGGEITQLVGFFWHLPNPTLKPEELESKEINLNWNIHSNLSLSFDIYQNTLEQQIVSRTYDAPQTLDGVFDGTFHGIPVLRADIPVNNANTKTDGYTIKLDHLTQLEDYLLTTFVAYSASDGKIDGDLPLTFMAEDTVRLGIEISKENWSIYLNGLNRSDTRRPTDARMSLYGEDYFLSKGYSNFNLFTRYHHQWTDSVEVEYQLKITNLADKKFTNATLSQDEGLVGSPQNTRKVELGINIRF